MKEERKSEAIHDALNLLDEDMIEAVDRLRETGKTAPEAGKRNRRKFPWHRITALAASVCLVVIASWSVEHFGDLFMEDTAETDEGVPGSNAEMSTEAQENLPEKEDIQQDGIDVDETFKKDILELKDNYISVSVLSHKRWMLASEEKEVMARAAVIDSKYKSEMDMLVEAMLTAETVDADIEEAAYHLFFETIDGKVIHLKLLENGVLCYEGKDSRAVQLDRSVYETIVKILEQYS